VTTRADIEKRIEVLKLKLLEFESYAVMDEFFDADCDFPAELKKRLNAASDVLRLFDELGVVEVLPGGVIREVKP